MSEKEDPTEPLVTAFRQRMEDRISLAKSALRANVRDNEYEAAASWQKQIRGYEDSLRALNEVCQESQQYCHLAKR